jgi:drug/metabolite transporter (DMT)-like permease
MGEGFGVLMAILSSALGGMSAGTTRFVVGAMDPVTLGAFRYGGGFLVLLPVTLALGGNWPRRKDWLGVACLGLLFFAVFPVLYNISLAYTTAARGGLALSILPLLTMLVAAVLGIETLTARKSLGVAIAMTGVAFALAAGLAEAPAGAWRGDLIMVAAAFCMALYNVWSRPFIARSGPFPFTAASMGAGGLVLVLLAGAGGGSAAVSDFGAAQWLAVGFLAIFGSALTFFLWVFALQRTTPTRVASTITVNPVMASIVAAILVGEPIALNLATGIIAVFAGIWIASTTTRAERGRI